MFLVNSCLNLFTAACRCRHPFSRSYGVILPSSLTIVRSLTLGFSPHLPVSVCGTGTLDLTSGFSWQREISRFSSFASPSQLCLGCTDLPIHQPHCLDAVKPTPRSTYPSASPRRSNDPWWYRNLCLLSIAYSFRSRLRPRLTLRGRTFLRKP